MRLEGEKMEEYKEVQKTLSDPKEYFKLMKKNYFFAYNELATPACEDGSEPLTFHHETFSRFHFAIINEEKKTTIANISVSHMPGIFEEARMRYQLQYMRQEGTEGDWGEYANSPAFTVKISGGTFRGETPAEVLLRDPETNKELLEKQISFLQQNLSKYPRNQTQIEAIEEAIELYENGIIKKNEGRVPVRKEHVLYRAGVRPLIRRKRASDGKCFVYDIAIYWKDGAQNPVRFEIKNYYAPVIQKENGLLMVNYEERDSVIVNGMDMSADEWFWFEHMTKTQLRTFENLYAPSLYKKALDADKYNREQAALKTK